MKVTHLHRVTLHLSKTSNLGFYVALILGLHLLDVFDLLLRASLLIVDSAFGGKIVLDKLEI